LTIGQIGTTTRVKEKGRDILAKRVVLVALLRMAFVLAGLLVFYLLLETIALSSS
jgi:hypothetical protein